MSLFSLENKFYTTQCLSIIEIEIQTQMTTRSTW